MVKANKVFSSLASFLTQLHPQSTPCLCFPRQFALVVSSFSANEISRQPAIISHMGKTCHLTTDVNLEKKQPLGQTSPNTDQ